MSKFSPDEFIKGRFYTGGRTIRPDNASMAVFKLRTHYPTGRTWANICSSSGYASQVYKTGTRRIIRLDELSFEIRLERRTTKDSSSGRIMRLVPVFKRDFKIQRRDGHENVA